MLTTIQLNEEVKKVLARMKSDKESYEDVIVKLIEEREKEERMRKDLLIEGCKVMAEESLRITREFEAVDAEIDWEWKGSDKN